MKAKFCLTQACTLGFALSTSLISAQTYSLGSTNLLEGPSIGTDSVVLAVSPTTAIWTANPNDSWLHLSAGNQSGIGPTNIIFTFDANSGATRTGTLTIAGQTLTVTQAGYSYAAGYPCTIISLVNPIGLAVDGAGNVYMCIHSSSKVLKWTAASNTLATLIPYPSGGLHSPNAISLDTVGNVYLSEDINAIVEWQVANSNTVTLVASGLSYPSGVAVDGAGNVYIADYYNNAIKEWIAASSNVITLVSSGLSHPIGISLDGAGNVYIIDAGNKAIKEWTASNSNLITLVSSGLSIPTGVAVDDSGNVYIADAGNNSIYEWTAANNMLTTVTLIGSPSPGAAQTVAVDRFGNIYYSVYSEYIEEWPRAYVNTNSIFETHSAGTDALPAVLSPATVNLTGGFAPASDSSWLTITGTNNGVVSFAFTSTATNRTAHITVLGRTIAVTQSDATAPVLTGAQLTGGVFSFRFTNSQDATFTVWTATNVALPFTGWTVAGPATNIGSGLFQFSTTNWANDLQRFYRVSSP